MSKLPDKPSGLIRVAIKDLQLCEKDLRYEMAKTLETPSKDYVSPFGIRLSIFEEDKLCALDELRCYKVREFLDSFVCANEHETEKMAEKILSDLEIVFYRENPETFKSNMLTIADRLEKMGY